MTAASYPVMPTMSRRAAGFALSLALALWAPLSVDAAFAQSGPFCSTFGANDTEGWGACSAQPNIAVSTTVGTTAQPNSTGNPTDYYLLLEDHSGASAACNTSDLYTGDWIKKFGECAQFCFDFKLFHAGSPPAPVTPSFSIYGPPGTGRATFSANFMVTPADPWKRICAPIVLAASPPSNGFGQWTVSGSASWNSIITNVMMVQLPIDFTSQPSEVAGYDNLCVEAGKCGSIKIEKTVDFGCTFNFVTTGAGLSNFSLSPANNSTAATTFSNLSPGSFMVTETAVPGYDLVGLSCTGDLNGDNVIDLANGAVTIKLDAGEDQVCTFTNHEHVDDVSCLTDAKAEVTCNADGTVTATLTTTAPAGFSGAIIEASSMTPGVTVSPAQQTLTAGQTQTQWVLAGGTPGQHVTLLVNQVEPGGGSEPGVDLCCSTEVEVVIPECPKPIDVAIEKTGDVMPATEMTPAGITNISYTLAVTNAGAAFSGSGIITVFDSPQPGTTFTSVSASPPLDWNCAIDSYGNVNCTYIGSGPVGPGDPLGTITITATATGEGPWENCASVGTRPLTDIDDSNDKSCVTLPKPPIDVSIGKEDTPDGGSGTWFNLWVTNVGAAPISFAPGELTVTENIPVGMTATVAYAPGWTCLPTTVVGANQMTCTYNLGGSLAAGAQLPGTIRLNYTTKGPGPFENCASIAVGSAVGVDTNQDNNKACVTVTPNEERPGILTVWKKVDNRTDADLSSWTYPVTVTCDPAPNASFTLADAQSGTVTVPFGVDCKVDEDVSLVAVPREGCPPGQVPQWTRTIVPPGYAHAGDTMVVENVLECVKSDIVMQPKPVAAPDLSVEKTGPRTCEAGQTCPFTITITNVGTGVFQGPLSVNDQVNLPGAEITAATSGWTCATGTCLHPEVMLETGESTMLTVNVRIPSSASRDFQLEQCAMLEAPKPGNEPVRFVQQMLAAAGIDVGAPDNQIGRKTRAGIEAFRARAGLPDGTEIDDKLLMALGALIPADANPDNDRDCAEAVITKTISCDFGFKAVGDTCQPICTQPNSHFDGSGCVICRGGTEWNARSRTCVSTVTCRSGEHLVSGTCKPICTRAGSHWDGKQCVICGNGLVWEANSRTCVRGTETPTPGPTQIPQHEIPNFVPDTPNCAFPQVFNPATGRCVDSGGGGEQGKPGGG